MLVALLALWVAHWFDTLNGCVTCFLCTANFSAINKDVAEYPGRGKCVNTS